jgi:hypothetical protein
VHFAERETHGASGKVRRYRVAGEVHDPSAAAVSITHGGERRVYTRRLRAAHAALVLMFSGVFVVGPIGESVGHHDWGRVVAAAVVLTVGCLLAAAVLRRGIVVTPGRVTVRGLVTTRHLPVSDVDRFEPPLPYGKIFGRVALRIVLHDGRVRTSGAFTNTPVDAGATAGRRECDELNRWLALERGTSPETVELLPDHVPDARLRRVVACALVALGAAFAVLCLFRVVLDAV